MNIVLTGFMASGKTQICKAISEMSQYTYIDTDDMIEEKAGMTVNEIFDRYGEEHFRSLEREAVSKAASTENAVIATGGGVVLDVGNLEKLRSTGVIFNLSPDFDVIRVRIEDARATRPLLQNESIDSIHKRFLDRKPLYDNCDHKIHVIHGRTPRSYAIEIINIMENTMEDHT